MPLSIIFVASERPFLIGIAGDSASGKTTFAKSIISLFGSDNVLSISLDDYHLYDRDERKEMGVTPLDPKANDLKLIYKQVKSLKEGKKIHKPVYDHSSGKFAEPVWVEPKEIVIIEGLHTLYRKKTRELFDITIYMDPDYETKKEWKMERDVKRRGHKEEGVMEQMNSRMPDYRKYIGPQRNLADMLIQIKKDLTNKGYDKGSPYWIRIFQRITGEKLSKVYFPLDLSSMCAQEAEELYFEYTRAFRRKKEYSLIEFNGRVARNTLSDIEEKIKDIAGKRGDILENDIVSEIELGQLIITWRVAERYHNLPSG